MKKEVLVVIFVVFVISLFMGVIDVFGQTPTIDGYLFNGIEVDGDTTIRLLRGGQELQSLPGGCDFTPPYFIGEKRNLLLNEDSTKIEVVYDPKIKAVCAQVWGAWPGTQENNGVSEFDSVMKVYGQGFSLIAIDDKSLINSNPAVNGVPFHRYQWEVPRGGGEYYMLFDFFQQQVLGNERLGMSHRDWSGIFKGELWKIYLPLIFKPSPPPTPTPTPPPTCPSWTIEASAPGFNIPALTYKIGGNHYPTVGYLYFGQTMSVSIKNANGTSNLPAGGETTVYNGSGTVVAEYGRSGSFNVVGGQGPYGEDFFTFDSSFPWQGISCRASFTIWDPELVLNSLEEKLGVSRQEAIGLLNDYLASVTTTTASTSVTTVTTPTQADIWDWVETTTSK